ncbi:hypothetical protein GV794_27295 [Nocardia cyriacigeorgica]|uniref:Uncharacterized protein n=1 Tax=Nocardia cyriacigeorgica TaxID=135487 RepID=A0ABX0CT06_9NOCA|nr:hypothetical protein [Nocardia cyriacigeorgica]NEW37438.1 hypothetical protein [Nocardia cyriacigeorgica]NEW49173.1 hypothetical protein [Nocardia cyriacigeorgica]NEW59311.1 hypothetical protein [Nocardia cyriacigeorgica]
MRTAHRVVTSLAIAATSIGLTLATAPAASAEEGVSGCISYSYHPGTLTTTVYYRNRCDVPRHVYIHRVGNQGTCDSVITIRVPGNKKGNEVVRCGEVKEVIGEDR